ncbi:phosphate transport system regulatory protein PhoU, partial [Thiohalocapsa halophila]
GHIVRSYDEELAALRTLVLDMGVLVLEQTSAAVGALSQGEIEQARRVLDRERKVAYFVLDADDMIFNLIAKRQPAAIDLRLVLALSKVVAHLERVGSRAGRIAWSVVNLLERGNQQPSAKILHHVTRLHQLATEMLQRSLDALANTDVDAALEVFADNIVLDQEIDAAMRHLMNFVLEDPALVGQVLELVMAMRALSCIGDQGGNIAEQIVFIAKGKDVRYQNREILIDALRQRAPSH